jgi:hypothetical protein
LKLLNPGGMGNRYEKDLIADGLGLSLLGDGVSDNVFPGPPEGLGLYLAVNLQAFQRALKD